MNIQNKNYEENGKSIKFFDQSINHYVCYSNILGVGCDFLKDNEVNDFSLINYIDNSDKNTLFDKGIFL